ncbi:MAG TPA: NAD(P)/FAD-dependent oxidoreductase [Alphaproteobacteria bacterium]|jgi:L-2-hydroxyglutarate oxidase LhgO|nr:NAD(P)/FAD-dependent oxidoreductase [Alphaproteobacteria bacterium]
MSDSIECAVIGAGVVGLAVARALAVRGHEVVVLEAEDAFGTHTSSRNSEVIHAGIYYPKDSLKAKFCVEGKKRLYAYCTERGINHRNVGKLIVAVEESEMASLKTRKAAAETNGVMDLRWLTAAEAKAMEPQLHCVGAILSPSTGIIDSHGLMLAYLGDVEDRGGALALKSPVTGGAVEDDGIRLTVGGDSPIELKAKIVVNSAGFSAPKVARSVAGIPGPTIPKDYLAKGVYFILGTKAPFERLVYPVPELAGLGIHLTLDLGGRARFGPDVEWVDHIDYSVDPKRSAGFYSAIRRYWPALEDGALVPGYAGVRPKIQGPGEPARDFMVVGPEVHGVPGLVNLFGIESPGLTSSMAIGEHVADLLDA